MAKHGNCEPTGSEMGFVDHLDALRKHIVRSLLAVFLFAAFAFFLKNALFDEIVFAPKSSHFFTNRLLCEFGDRFGFSYLCQPCSFRVVNIDVAGQFRAHLAVSSFVGIVLGFPFLSRELWLFLKPALKGREVATFRNIMLVVPLLFYIGIFFGYFVLCPLTIHFLSNYSVSAQLTNAIALSSYISLVATLSLSAGIVFQLPVAVYLLARIGIITSKTMRKFRKHSVVALSVVAGIITPPDVFSQFLVAIPLYLLYELSLAVVVRGERKWSIADFSFCQTV